MNWTVPDATPDPSSHAPLPPAPRTRSLAFGLPPAGRRWPGGLRAALAFGVPALLAVAFGHQEQALIFSLGAFAVIYGEGRAYRVRWRVVFFAGVALLASAALGVLIGGTVYRAWPFGSSAPALIEVVALAAVALVGTYVVSAARLGPPGSFFFVLVCSVATIMAGSELSTAVILGCTAIGVISAMAVSMSGALVDRHGPERDAVATAARAIDSYVALRRAGGPSAAARHGAATAVSAAWTTVYDAGLPEREPDSGPVRTLYTAHLRLAGIADTDPTDGPDRELDTPTRQIPLARPNFRYRVRRSLTFDSHAAGTTLRVVVACLVAGGLSVAAGFDRPDWAVIAAVLILHQGPDRIRGTVRGLHRFAGTAAGLVLFAGLYALEPSSAALILLLMALQFLIELFIARNYGLAVIFITPLAMLIGGASHPDAAIGPMIRDRFVETLIGVVVALAVLWSVDRRAHRRDLRWTETRTLEMTLALVSALRGAAPTEPSVMALRRDVQFELIGAGMSAADAVHNERAWMRLRWARHVEITRLGYDLLARCWAVSPGGRLADPDGWEARLRRITRDA
ncbi:Fusaric acid resistance protein-like [Rhodococcus maanshanensis]|uniref:Fusaric acid resistance protein-like n=1 Tax=Rhodococcus maanshanensis TaxID=183556 RepID=A0A1H7HZ85_9NOCA|nr:Fusaric acid resistance protein-like [Rhodococcus maanshanensis]